MKEKRSKYNPPFLNQIRNTNQSRSRFGYYVHGSVLQRRINKSPSLEIWRKIPFTSVKKYAKYFFLTIFRIYFIFCFIDLSTMNSRANQLKQNRVHGRVFSLNFRGSKYLYNKRDIFHDLFFIENLL